MKSAIKFFFFLTYLLCYLNAVFHQRHFRSLKYTDLSNKQNLKCVCAVSLQLLHLETKRWQKQLGQGRSIKQNVSKAAVHAKLAASHIKSHNVLGNIVQILNFDSQYLPVLNPHKCSVANKGFKRKLNEHQWKTKITFIKKCWSFYWRR